MGDIGLFDRLALAALYRLEPEAAHNAALWALEHGLAGSRSAPDDSILATNVWGLEFRNPIGLAAGFDKDARVADAMLRLGFGFVEAGTVTPLPQPGNPQPRLFRLEEDAGIINRLGFNSGGVEAFADRLRARRQRPSAFGVVGANVGKNKDTVDGAADYVTGIESVAPYADYIVCNISSPNTPGLRALQARAPIEDLLRRALAARARALPGAAKLPPLLVKIAPDLSDDEMRDVAEISMALNIDGIMIGNTTIARGPELKSRHRNEAGGLSGEPLFALSTRRLADMYRLTEGRMILIGTGGIGSGAQAYAKIRAGASLVQVYSALIFKGPGVAARIARDLADLLRSGGFSSVAAAVGADHRK